jgi:hypothetical protein
MRHLVNQVHDLTARGIGLKVLAGELVFGIFAALAEFDARRSPNAPRRASPRLAQAAMGKPETKIGPPSRELGATRQALYRHLAPDGSLREHGAKLLGHRTCPITAAAMTKA